jgi:hypothetical protein
MSKSLQLVANQVTSDITTDVLAIDDTGMVIVKAPPGAGKTYLLLQLLQQLKAKRVAVACFTNAQADDICRRCATEHPNLNVIRYLSASAPTGLSGVQEVTSGNGLPNGPVAVIANTAKWSLSKNPEFDYLLVDEAWQIAWADLMLLRNLAARVVLIGDPGQIPPVVSIETARWETSSTAPHRPSPEHFVVNDPGIALHALPGSRRLPTDTVDLVRNFYDFDFGAFAETGERFVRVSGDKSPVGRAISGLSDRSISTLLLPTDDSGPPAEIDDEIAVAVADMIAKILGGGAVFSDGEHTKNKPVLLKPEHIGIVATHRSMNTRLLNRLPANLRSSIKVDTTERWQGLERKLMIAIHPLSSTASPSAFDLETGRLCVMASRHQSGLIIVSRDHVKDTLGSHIHTADQPLGRPDSTGRGLDGHRAFWKGITS